jgi:outer membrane protein TolC
LNTVIAQFGRKPACVLITVLCIWASAEGQQTGPATPLPNPLTLDAALALADESHPDRDEQIAQIAISRADLAASQASYGLNAYFALVPRWVDPAVEPGHEFVNDSRAGLFLYKKLWDFGRGQALSESAAATVRAEEFTLIDVRQQRRLEVMARFLDVILADLKFLADDEEMALRYVQFDKAATRRGLEMISEVDLLRLETAYREAFDVRAETQAQQRYARMLLALALNRPDQAPQDLARPEFAELARKEPKNDTVMQQALSGNPLVTAMRARVEAAQLALSAEQALRRPVLSAEAGAAYLEREIGSRDEARIGLRLRFPLYQGGSDRAAAARAEAELEKNQAALRKAELVLRQQVLGLLKRLDTMRVQRRTAQIREDYRDLAVDLARGLYEMEVRTNLGESLARLTEAQWQSAKVEFETALTWARLDALLGKLVTTASTETKQ